MLLTGVFAGPIAGLRYKAPSGSGTTNEKGEFSYREGERVAFLLGDVAFGSAMGAPRLDLAKIVSRVDGDVQKLLDPGLTNIARFICSLDRDGDLDGGIAIAPRVHDIIGGRDVTFAGPTPDHVRDFESDPAIADLLDELGRGGAFTTKTPRRLVSAAAARNEIRRHILGIRKFRDVRIDLENGSFVYADVFRPDKEGVFPVIMNCGVYGRAFHHHSICSEDDYEAHELEEERYFLGNADGLIFENHETVNTADWVPHDYAVVRVDGPGTGKSPGKLAPWGFSTAEAFRDAIDWAGAQPWSNGAVGLWGMSYYAMTQQAVASLRPSHLISIVSMFSFFDM